MARKDIGPPEPWERQPGEGPQAFACFAAYRDSGAGGRRRSIKTTAESLTKRDGRPYSYGTLRYWSQKYGWKARADAFDREMDREAQDELRRGRTAMLKSHVGIARAMLAKASRALEGIPDAEITAQDVARLVDTASKLERISRGEATERTEGRQELAGGLRAEASLSVGAPDLSRLSDGELESLGEILGKLAGD